MADNSADDRWTVRGVPKGYREAAAKAADRRKITVGAFLCAAVDREMRAEREPIDLIPPRGKMADTPGLTRESDIGSAMMTIGALKAMAEAQAAGLPVSKAAARDAVRVVRAQVRIAGGLPVLKVRGPSNA